MGTGDGGRGVGVNQNQDDSERRENTAAPERPWHLPRSLQKFRDSAVGKTDTPSLALTAPCR